VTVNSLNVFVFIIKSGLRIISIYFELQRYSVSNYFPVFSTTNEKACHQVADGAKDLIKTFRANLFDVLALEKKGIQNMIQKSYDSITLVYLD